MLEIQLDEEGRVVMCGRLDSAQVDKAHRFFADLESPQVIDCAGLEFISSAGLGVLLVLTKRALGAGGTLTLCNVSSQIREVFRHTGLETVFQIEEG